MEVTIEVLEILAETEKSYQVEMPDGKETYLPKQYYNYGLIFILPKWLAKKMGV